MICKVLKKYGCNDSTIDLLCKKLLEYVPENEYELLCKDIYEAIQGPHFNEDFAKWQISKMYYEENGMKYYAPYWNDITLIYTLVKRRIPLSYTKWDFEVALNMIKSDNYLLLKSWFPDDVQDKIVEMTVNWLNDEDNPYGDSKVWGYFKK